MLSFQAMRSRWVFATERLPLMVCVNARRTIFETSDLPIINSLRGVVFDRSTLYPLDPVDPLEHLTNENRPSTNRRR
jgi:hypothetical protein